MIDRNDGQRGTDGDSSTRRDVSIIGREEDAATHPGTSTVGLSKVVLMS